MTCHLDVSHNPFPIDYDVWLTTEPDEDEEYDPRQDEPADFDERRWREGE